MSTLPQGWAQARIGELASKIGSGATPRGGAKAYKPSGTPLLRSLNVHFDGVRDEGIAYIDDEQAAKLDNVQVETADVLLNITGASIGRVAIAPERYQGARVNQHVAIIRTVDGVEPSFLSRLLASPDAQSRILEENYGVTRQALTKGMIEDFPVCLPPLPEQRRIVAKLDRLSARSAAARDRLSRTTRLATRAKQAILGRAFSGELTSNWRLDRIQNGLSAEPTLRACSQQRADLLASAGKHRRGKGLAEDHHRIPVEIAVPNTWSLSSLELVTSPIRLIQYGILKPGNDFPGGVPYVKVMNIRDDIVNLESIRRTTPEIHTDYLRSALRAGDLLLTIRGTVGRLAFVPPELDGGNITQDTVRIDVLPAMNSRFIFWYLHSPQAERYFKDNQKGVAVRGINVGDVRPMETPVPSRDEQDEIVRRIEAAFARIDRLTEEASRTAHLLDRLDERLLAKAFRGELVPQDPNDEPAEALLARIREARVAAPKAKRSRGRAAAQ